MKHPVLFAVNVSLISAVSHVKWLDAFRAVSLLLIYFLFKTELNVSSLVVDPRIFI
jgi:hypothetical protein